MSDSIHTSPATDQPTAPAAAAGAKPRSDADALRRFEELLDRYERSDSSEAKHIAEFMRDLRESVRDMSSREQRETLLSSLCEIRDDAQRALAQLQAP